LFNCFMKYQLQIVLMKTNKHKHCKQTQIPKVLVFEVLMLNISLAACLSPFCDARALFLFTALDLNLDGEMIMIGSIMITLIMMMMMMRLLPLCAPICSSAEAFLVGFAFGANTFPFVNIAICLRMLVMMRRIMMNITLFSALRYEKIAISLPLRSKSHFGKPRINTFISNKFIYSPSQPFIPNIKELADEPSGSNGKPGPPTEHPSPGPVHNRVH